MRTLSIGFERASVLIPQTTAGRLAFETAWSSLLKRLDHAVSNASLPAVVCGIRTLARSNPIDRVLIVLIPQTTAGRLAFETAWSSLFGVSRRPRYMAAYFGQAEAVSGVPMRASSERSLEQMEESYLSCLREKAAEPPHD
jgi:hypothetical protein